MEMNEIERIDDYITGRLSGREKEDFEKQMEANPSMREDVILQRQIADGIRKARAAELKRMLNNVPVGGNGWSPGKIAATALTAGLVASALYFYLGQDPVAETSASQVVTQQPAQIDKKETTTETTTVDAQPDKTKEEAAGSRSTATKNQPLKEEEAKPVNPVRKPNLDVVDPTEELEAGKDHVTNDVTTQPSVVEVSKMEVITSAADRKYKFHYQFREGKLMLFGPFDKELYEVLEIHGDSHAVFLFYKSNYYLLDEKQNKISPLTPIKDSQLLQRLREYRGK